MPDTFAITIIFIVFCTVIGAFIKGRTKDTCLKDFEDYSAILEELDGKVVWGKLRVENSAIEFVYPEPYLDEKDKHTETSFVLYKKEYPRIKTLIRYVDDLDKDLALLREKNLKRTYAPGWYTRFARKGRNFFGTVRDSLVEVINLFMGRVKASAPMGNLLKGQDKYISQMQQQAVGTLNTSYDPVLERYIGQRVVLAVFSADKKEEYAGILKEYTTEFIEIMDARYMDIRTQVPRKADLVFPRSLAVVRHGG